MNEIDKPFRFTLDFCLIWGTFTIVVWFLSRQMDLVTWYSHAAFIIVGSLLATFFIYGPVLLVRQAIHSGSRGWFVLRVFISIILVLSLFFTAWFVSGLWTETRGHIAGLILCAVATIYLHWRIDNRSKK
jgi:membrane-anchored protein YejM (alkaline phosphatase superfamily)